MFEFLQNVFVVLLLIVSHACIIYWLFTYFEGRISIQLDCTNRNIDCLQSALSLIHEAQAESLSEIRKMDKDIIALLDELKAGSHCEVSRDSKPVHKKKK